MQMIIDAKRLEALLSPARFALHLVDSRFGRIHFIRRSNMVELFESVVVENQGGRGEVVYGGIGISVTKTVMQKELGQVEWPAQVAEDKQRLWTIIESKSKAIEWERRLAEVAPELAIDLAKRQGDELLKNTEEVRRAAAVYLENIDRNITVVEQLERLHSNATEKLLRSAKQFAKSPVVVHVENAEDVYDLTCLCILRFQAIVEPARTSYLDENLLSNKHLGSLIEIVADELLHRYGRLPSLGKDEADEV
jgi:hypothetical protein